ncbi:MAG: helix-turn-helix domain-containing protein [Tannerellaceae bacterium]|jgi:predicted DNA-binding transcriptional regulator YafY|nr:helix-turn-helix domain-containing protein [Tannerellaceae bacterium]
MQLFETINRVYRMHQLIQREATGTSEEFAKRFELKRRQLYNILDEFKSYGANIHYSRKKQTFYYVNEFEIIIKINVLPSVRNFAGVKETEILASNN